MFGSSLFREMEQDDFFEGHRAHMRQMEEMMKNPFRGAGFGMLEDKSDRREGRQRGDDREKDSSNALAPFGRFPGFDFGNMFGNMEKIFSDVDKAFVEASQRGDGHSFSEASVMSYSKSGDGAPKIYQASTATKRGPGGIRETRKALRDSERELEKMSLGRHINDRGHEIEKHRNTRSGQIEELQNFRNIDEREAEAFDHEWYEKSRNAFKGLENIDRLPARRERRELVDRPHGSDGYDRERYDRDRYGRDRVREERDRQREERDRYREERDRYREERDRYREERDRQRDDRRDRREQLALPDPRSSPDKRSEHWGHTADERGRARS